MNAQIVKLDINIVLVSQKTHMEKSQMILTEWLVSHPYQGVMFLCV